VFPPGQAREDWKILRALSEVLGCTLPFDSHAQLRQKLVEAYPHFARVDEKPTATWTNFGRDGVIDTAAFTLPIRNFYHTNTISRASPTMAACVQEILMPRQEAAE
jgi:NADH-quinone oxidoreductase subunit G